MAQKFSFRKIEAKFRKARTEIPRRVAKEVVNHSKKAFKDQGFTDETLSPWRKRTTKNKADRATGKNRAILIDSGNLRRSIRAGVVNWDKVTVGAYGIDYATYHNQGTARLPRRRFLGPSKVLTRKIQQVIRNEIKKTFQ